MVIQESAENYLEAILMIKQSKGEVHSVDIAAMLGFRNQSHFGRFFRHQTGVSPQQYRESKE